MTATPHLQRRKGDSQNPRDKTTLRHSAARTQRHNHNAHLGAEEARSVRRAAAAAVAAADAIAGAARARERLQRRAVIIVVAVACWRQRRRDVGTSEEAWQQAQRAPRAAGRRAVEPDRAGRCGQCTTTNKQNPAAE